MDLNIDQHRRYYVQQANNVLVLSLLYLVRRKKKRKQKRFWVRNIFANRKNQGAFYNLLQEMRLGDSEKYYNYLRMSSETFKKLLRIVGPRLTKLYCVREPIPPAERLALTLRYLASGDSMISISYAFRIAPNTVSGIIKETCNIIWDCLSADVLLKPTQELWLKIANDFEHKWQLPHCVEALDGKHVVMQAPPKQGSTWFNYKGTHSMVLLALCDANYRFTVVDIGSEGRHSDGGILKNSMIGKLISSNSFDLPAPSLLMEDDEELLNYFICADEAFPLTTCIMRPYAGRFLQEIKRIFNYRLCRARRVIENVFGILAARWRIYRRTIIASESTVEAVVKATVCLHNFLMNLGDNGYFTYTTADRENGDGEIISGDWRNQENDNLLPIRQTSSNMYGRYAEQMRDKLARYFINEGAIPFQWNK